MTPEEQKEAVCFDDTQTSKSVYVLLNVLPSAIYLILASYTFTRFHKEVLRLNRILLFSWAIESVYRIVLAFIYGDIETAPVI